jgi:hypothetical protein
MFGLITRKVTLLGILALVSAISFHYYKDGYISGIVQNGPGNSLLLAFKLPTQSDKTPPIVMTASYEKEDLPLKQMRFRVFNSSVMSMVLYSSHQECVEATMQ